MYTKSFAVTYDDRIFKSYQLELKTTFRNWTTLNLLPRTSAEKRCRLHEQAHYNNFPNALY